MRRLGLALAALLMLAASTGCAAVRAQYHTEDALEAAGFHNASVGWSSYEGVESVDVTWDARAETVEDLAAEALAAAGVVWRVAPVRFDVVSTDPDVSFPAPAVHRVFERAMLANAFGPRPPGLDRSFSSLLGIRHILVWVGIGVVAFVLASVLVVVLVLRSARRRRAAASAA